MFKIIPENNYLHVRFQSYVDQETYTKIQTTV